MALAVMKTARAECGAKKGNLAVRFETNGRCLDVDASKPEGKLQNLQDRLDVLGGGWPVPLHRQRHLLRLCPRIKAANPGRGATPWGPIGDDPIHWLAG